MGNERGSGFIELIIALGLLSTIGMAFFGVLSTSYRVLSTADERTTSESLARSEMEYAREQDYQIAPWFYELPTDPPSWDTSHTLPAGYDDYSVSVDAVPIQVIDNGIQKITVTISHENEVIILESYKSGR